jgi:hypothetical protein
MESILVQQQRLMAAPFIVLVIKATVQLERVDKMSMQSRIILSQPSESDLGYISW